VAFGRPMVWVQGADARPTGDGPAPRRTAQSMGMTDAGPGAVLGAGDIEAIAARVVELLDRPLQRLLTADEVTWLLAVDVALRRPGRRPRAPKRTRPAAAVGLRALVNGARRLQAICAGWARCRQVAVVR
jgi:hypothetical protein